MASGDSSLFDSSSLASIISSFAQRKQSNSRKRKGEVTSTSRPPRKITRRARNNNAHETDEVSDEQVRIVKRTIPRKTADDPNEYEIVTLSNGMTVCLISRHPDFALVPSDMSAFDDLPGRDSSFGNNQLFLGHSHKESLRGTLEASCKKVDVWERMEESSSLMEEITKPFSCTSCNPFEEGPDADIASYVRRPRGYPSPQTVTSVAVVVNVGSIDNPRDWQGLAHFTEHMVHYGSRKYQEENARDEIIVNFGTTSNAYTQQHSTTYYFEIPDILLERSLDMMSDMLSYPTFEEDMLKREVHAVDNEFHMKRHADGLRRWMLLQHEAIKDEHCFSFFNCGSLETLGEENGDVQNAMREFHRKNYVASATTICINGSQTIEQLEDLTLRHFAGLLKGDRQTVRKEQKRTQHLNQEKLIGKNAHDKLIVLQGLSSWAQLTFAWQMPSKLWSENGNAKVLDMLQAMFTDSSERSLDGYLRKEGLILEMLATSNTHLHRTNHATFFQADFMLTEKGQSRTRDILGATFAFLDTLRSTPENEMKRLFCELNVENERKFRFGVKSSGLYHTIRCAEAMQYMDEEGSLLTSDTWSTAEFDYKSVINCLNLLKSDNLIIIDTLPKTSNLEDVVLPSNIKTAPYTQAKYGIIEPRNDLKTDKEFRPNFQFGFIPPNPLLNTVNRTQNGGGDSGFLGEPINYGEISPQPLVWPANSSRFGNRDNAFPKISGIHWGNCDTGINSYFGFIEVVFFSPTVYRTVRSRALTHLWAMLIDLQLDNLSSPIRHSGGSDYKVQCISDGIKLSVTSLVASQSLEILKTLVVSMFRLPIEQTHFNLAKQSLHTHYSEKLGSIDVLVGDILNNIFYETTTLNADVVGQIDDFTLEELNNHINLFKMSTYAHVTMLGNVPVASFKSVSEILDEQHFGPFHGNPLTYKMPLLCTVPILCPPDVKCVRVKSDLMNSYCTTVLNYYNLVQPSSPEILDCFKFALSFMRCQAFQFLRTRHQLGYSVQVVGPLSASNMSFAIILTATANKFSPCEIDMKIDEFLEYYRSYLENLPQEHFDTMRNIKGITGRVTKQDVAQWYGSVFPKDFNKNNKKSNQVLKLPRNILAKLSIQMMGNEAKTCTCEKCTNIDSWTRGRNDKSNLFFAKGSGPHADYYIDDLKFMYKL